MTTHEVETIERFLLRLASLGCRVGEQPLADRLQRRDILMPLFHACLVLFLLATFSALAEEVNIGHLETKDDTGINWLFFHCNKSSDQTRMQCDIIQTLFTKATTEETVAKESKELEEVGPLVQFNKSFSDACKHHDYIPKMEQFLAAGKDKDGKPINNGNRLTALLYIKSIKDVCDHPSDDVARNFFNKLIQKELKTCHVQNIYSNRTFTLDYQTNTWTNQEGPKEPCGTIALKALRQEEKPYDFWNYVEREVHLKPDGILPGGKSCRLSPEHTLNYTWRTTATFEGCDYVESNPD